MKFYEFIEQDCLYNNAYNFFKDEPNCISILEKAGLIKEPRTDEDSKILMDYEIISMPLNNKYSSNNAIIVSTGSFSPMHEGHVQSMMIAKDYVEKMGFNVIQGVFSLSHDAYVSFKNNGIAKKNVSERTLLAYEKILKMKQESWIKIDRLEGEMVSCAINFSTVLNRVNNYTKHHLNIDKLTVFYVFGSDNATFAHAFINNDIYHALCIERQGYDYSYLKDSLKENKNIHFIENNSIYKNFSSTEVRKNQTTIQDDDTDNKKEPLYLIRENGAPEEFCVDLKEILKKYIKSVKIKSFRTIETNKKGYISLDKFISGDYNIDTSRLFEISSHQAKANKMVSLSQPLEEQIKNIPAGKYNLLDDDSVSGYTINKITKLLEQSQINITNTEMIINEYINDNEYLFDVIDAKDFIINDSNGLVVEDLNGEYRRVPYLFPEVNLTTRANIAPKHQMAFSKEVCLLNKKHFKETVINIKKIEKLIMIYNNFLGGVKNES